MSNPNLKVYCKMDFSPVKKIIFKNQYLFKLQIVIFLEMGKTNAVEFKKHSEGKNSIQSRIRIIQVSL